MRTLLQGARVECEFAQRLLQSQTQGPLSGTDTLCEVGACTASVEVRLDKQRTQTLLDELRQSEWHTGRWFVPVDHLWLMQRGPDDPAWRYIHRIDLTGQAQ